MVPQEIPHDTRICIEDLVNTNVDESDSGQLREEREMQDEWTMEHNVDVPVPQTAETGRVKEVTQLITRDRISDCDKLAKL